MDIDILGIDLSKRVFQLHGADNHGYVQYGAKVMRADLKELGFDGSYDRDAAFARIWRAGQPDRGNSASKRTYSFTNELDKLFF